MVRNRQNNGAVLMRLFIAAPAKIKRYEELRETFCETLKAKWVVPENLHLTYLFLGEYDPKEAINRLKGIKYEKFEAPGIGLALFGKPPRILYTPIKEKRVYLIQRQIASRFQKFDKKFVAHVTLARIKGISDLEGLYKTVSGFNKKPILSVVNEIGLYKSELKPEGAVYTLLESF